MSEIFGDTRKPWEKPDYWYVGTDEGIRFFVNENRLTEREWRFIAPRPLLNGLTAS
jgi:hypothetical protein